MKKPKKDLSNQRFGRLITLRYVFKKGTQWMWECRCDCGAVAVVSASSLQKSQTKSCGCLRTEVRTKHGKSSTKEYHAWQSMRDRCYNQKNKGYVNYGGRGIRVCESWRESFDKFFMDMGTAPSAKHSIDRIDVNGEYTKDNCRWATVATQRLNIRMRKDNLSGHRGIRRRKNGKYLVKLGKQYLGTFSFLDDAIQVRDTAFAAKMSASLTS